MDTANSLKDFAISYGWTFPLVVMVAVSIPVMLKALRQKAELERIELERITKKQEDDYKRGFH